MLQLGAVKPSNTEKPKRSREKPDAPATTSGSAHVDFTQPLRQDVHVTQQQVLLAGSQPTGATVMKYHP